MCDECEMLRAKLQRAEAVVEALRELLPFQKQMRGEDHHSVKHASEALAAWEKEK